ncbi:MAG: cupredoxin domain-containing protein [Gaiellaceae bacterium]
MKRLILLSLALTALALSVTALASGSTRKSSALQKTGTVLIQHQLKGCHAWSFDGGAFKASLTATIARGGTITFTDNDVMSHKLIEKSGPRVQFKGSPAMSRMGARVQVVFPKAGTYVFSTKAGEDYMKGVKTVGEDNVLSLKVVVR